MKYLMVFIVLIEELLKRLKNEVSYRVLMFILPLLVVIISVNVDLGIFNLYIVLFFMSLPFVIITGFIQGFGKDYVIIPLVFGFLVNTVLFFSTVSTIKETKGVKITTNTIEYDGLQSDVEFEINHCKSKLFNIKHLKREFLGNSSESISVECVEIPQKIQKI